MIVRTENIKTKYNIIICIPIEFKTSLALQCIMNNRYYYNNILATLRRNKSCILNARRGFIIIHYNNGICNSVDE